MYIQISIYSHIRGNMICTLFQCYVKVVSSTQVLNNTTLLNRTFEYSLYTLSFLRTEWREDRCNEDIKCIVENFGFEHI